MKSLANYIKANKLPLISLSEKLVVFHQQIDEKLVINKKYDSHQYHPTTWDELREIIEKRFEELGPGTLEESIDFNDIDVSNIVSFCNENKVGIFEGIEFEYIDISNWDVSKVKTMSYIFFKCDYLESVGDLSKWNVSNVEHMHSMFNGCTYLKSVGDLSDWNVSKVRNMTHMFTQCKKLKSVGDLSNWDVSNVEYMNYMFKGSGITNIPKWYKE